VISLTPDLRNSESLQGLGNVKNEYMFNMLLDQNHKELLKQEKRKESNKDQEENVISEENY